MNKKSFLLLALLACVFSMTSAQSYTYKIAKLKYRGGGDWYANPTSLPNLIRFANEQLGTAIDPQEAIVDIASPEIFRYPFVHMTGHGNVVFSRADAENLRRYLVGGGFLHIDDNYGMDPYIREEIKKIFPEADWVELPFSHPIYQQKFKFRNGLPKIHEHDGHPPQGFGIFHEGRLIVFYSYETDLGNGWEDPEVHNNPENLRLQALQMGANILQFVFLQ